MKRLWLIALFVLASMGFSMNAPIYYVKVISVGGTTIAAPLPVADVQFTDTVFRPGQHRLGEFTLTLQNSRDAKYLRATYAQLKARQRVEIYDNRDLLGDPVFSGVLLRSAKSLTGERTWMGNSYADWLNRRMMRDYHRLTGNAATVAQSLLQTHNVVFSDDFNRTTGFGADWSFPDGSDAWSITNNHVERLTAAGDQRMHTASTWAAASWHNGKVSFDLNFNNTDASAAAYLYFDSEANYISFGLPSDNSIDISIGSNGDGGNSRTLALDKTAWMRIDIYIAPSATSGKVDVIVYINGLEIIQDTFSATANASNFVIRLDTASATIPIQLDNFVFASAASILTAGTIDSTDETIDQVFNSDSSQLDALEWICEKLNWEYRIRPKAGAGNDEIDIGASVGTDWTGILTLNDGCRDLTPNIEALESDNPSDGLATQLNVRGQSRDDATSGFISVNLDAMSEYGIVEQNYEEERIETSEMAKAVGDNRLTILSAGDVSLSGRIADESQVFAQNPVWDVVDWDDFRWDGLMRFRAGDKIPVLSDDLAIDKTCEIVSLTRKSGEIGVPVVFDYHGWSFKDETRNLRRQMNQMRRALDLRMDTQSLVFTLSGTTALELSFNLRASLYKAIYLDVTSAAWGGQTITFAIDGTDCTTALFGAATIGADKFVRDTTYLIQSGVHTIELTPSGSVTVTVAIRPSLLG